MAHTRAWNESRPAGTDLVSSLDNTIREQLVDTREREALDHVWGTSQDHDGKHKKITLRPDANTYAIQTETSGSTTGDSIVGHAFINHTVNTTGVFAFITHAITKTASAAGSMYHQYYLDAVLKFYITLEGIFGRVTLRDYREVFTLVTSAAGVATFDISTANVFAITLTENVTLAFTNLPSGCKCSFEIWFTGDGTQRTVTFPAGCRLEGTYTPTATLGKLDVLTFHTFDAGTNMMVLIGGQTL